MQNWLPDLAARLGPKYLAIAAALTHDIETGRLRPGDRLPPQRSLAQSLSIDLTTVTKAYNEVRRLGLIEGGGRLGSFVRTAPALAEDIVIDTGMNLPPEPARGTLGDRMRTGLAALLTGPGAASQMRYQPSGGAPSDRAAAAAELRARGIDAADDMVLITSGGQNALHAVIAALLSAGDGLCTAPFVYPGLLSAARSRGARIIPIGSDAEGLDPDSLDRACRTQAAKAVYAVPTNDNPTAATMGQARRAAIADVARRHGIAIIEDDAYGRLPAQPLPPIACFAPDRTWHIASTSKILSPSLRVAWLRAPSAKQAWRAAAAIHEATIMAPPLNAALVTSWLRDGGFAALTDEIRREAVARQRIAADVLGHLPYVAHAEGYHLWMPLPAGASAADIVNALRPAGLSVVPSSAFAASDRAHPPALRISIGGPLSHERLAQTLRMLDAMVDHGGAQAPLV